jgi:hypothetical protein
LVSGEAVRHHALILLDYFRCREQYPQTNPQIGERERKRRRKEKEKYLFGFCFVFFFLFSMNWVR